MVIYLLFETDRYSFCVVWYITAGRRVGMADEADSKSVVGNHVRVQVPLPAVLTGAEFLWK